MKRTLLGLAPLTLAVATLSLACGDDGTADDEVGTETGDGDGDGDPGDGDGDPGDGDGDPGDGDGDPGDGDGDGDGEDPDTDMDGVTDSNDNCPDAANPNQLDFDGNGAGNTCDIQTFTTLSGTLNTTAHADAGIAGQCSIPLELEITGGEIQVQLDDDAAIAGFEIVELQIADILDKECPLALPAVVSLKDFTISNSGDPFPVVVAHSQEAHDAGSIAGDSDMPHPVLSLAILEASVNGGEPEESELMLDGSVPIFTANVMGGGASGTLAWADAQYVLAMDTFMVDGPPEVTIDFEMRGLVGSLSIAP